MLSRAWALTALLIVLAGSNLAGAKNGNNASQGTLPNGRPFTALHNEILTLKTQIDALVASNAAQDDLISALGGVVLALEARFAGVQASIEELKAHDALVDRWIDALEGQWRAAEARLEGHESDLQALFDADQALQQLMYALQVQADSLRDRLATLDGTLASLESLLRSDLAATEAALADLRVQLNSKQAALTQACPVGSSIRQISPTLGTVVCEVDDASSGGSVGQLQPSDFSDDFRTIGADAAGSSTMFCPSGWIATGGGFHKDLPGQIFLSSPASSSTKGSGWVVGLHNPPNSTGASSSVRAIIRCVRVVP